MARRTLSQLGLNVQAAPLAWARIGSVAGASSDVVYVDSRGVKWRCVQWAVSAAGGLVIAVPGIVDALIVGAGADNDNGSYTTIGGNGGKVLMGLFPLGAGVHAVTVGQSDAYGSGGDGAHSALGSLVAGITCLASGSAMGAGADAKDAGTNQYKGVFSSSTGSLLEYAPARNPARPGGGASTTYTTSGAAGTVIVRVPV